MRCASNPGRFTTSLQGKSHGAKRWIKSNVCRDTLDTPIVCAGTSTVDRCHRHYETQTYTVIDRKVLIREQNHLDFRHQLRFG